MKLFDSLYIVLVLILMSGCDRSTEQRKIKLSQDGITAGQNDQSTTTIHLESREQRSIAVMFFENLTGDNDLAWLQKGLTEMFIRTLSQSRSLSVLSSDRLIEILKRLKDIEHNHQHIDMDMAAVVAQEANVEAILTGNITRDGDSLRINVQIHESRNGAILKEKSIEGPGLETIFTMVDQLTRDIRKDLHLSLNKGETEQSIADLSTASIEAWQYYSTGADYSDKLFRTEAIAEFKKAIEIDSAFVPAYLELFNQYMGLARIEESNKILEKLKALKSKALPREVYQIDFLEASKSSDIKKVLAINKKWLEEFPDDREANFSMASVLYSTHFYKEAIPYYENVLRIDPKYKLAINQLGYTYAQLGDFEKAITALQSYQLVAPDEPNPYDSMGEIYWYFGDFASARKQYEKALLVNPDFYVTMQHLGRVYMDEGQIVEALSTYELYQKQAPSEQIRGDAIFKRGLAKWRLGETSTSLKLMEQSLSHLKARFMVIKQLHTNYIQLADTANANRIIRDQYRKISRLYTKDHKDMNALFDLILLAIWYDHEVEKTISIMEKALGSDQHIQQELRLTFLLTILYIKTNQTDKISSIWDTMPAEEQIIFFKELRQLSYSNVWEYYGFINDQYAKYPEQGIEYYNSLIKQSIDNDSQITEMIFRLFLAGLYQQCNQQSKALTELQYVGSPAEKLWTICGPYENSNGFNTAYPPETNTVTNKLNWQHHHDDKNDGYIDLSRQFVPSQWKVAYAAIQIRSPHTMDVQFRTGSNESIKIWCNQKEIWKFNDVRGAIFDDDIVTVTLKKGVNSILVKVVNRVGDWGFYFRVTDESGIGIKGLAFETVGERP